MLLTDTDSLLYKTEPENAFEDFCKKTKLLDFSNYGKDSNFKEHSNNLLGCKMKDETCNFL